MPAPGSLGARSFAEGQGIGGVCFLCRPAQKTDVLRARFSGSRMPEKHHSLPFVLALEPRSVLPGVAYSLLRYAGTLNTAFPNNAAAAERAWNQESRGKILSGGTMKHLAFCLAVFLALTVAVGVSAAEPPQNHPALLKNQDYKDAHERYATSMAEAKERLTADEYKSLEAANEQAIARGVRESMAGGETEANAYATEYWALSENTGRLLVWDWLRKNARGVQGFYKLKSGAYDGYMTIQEGEDAGSWAVYVFAAVKGTPEKNGELRGEGKLHEKTMTVSCGDSGEGGEKAAPTVSIVFDGESARITTSKAFKESGWSGNDVVLDGEYVREKKDAK